MISAHSRVFSALDNFCAEQQNPIKNSGSKRWTKTSNRKDKEWLLYADLNSVLPLAESLKICRFDHSNSTYFFTVGLNLPEEIDFLQEEDLGGGMLTAIISELNIPPTGLTSEIRNIVEFDDKDSNPDYKGHESESIAKFFPVIRCFSCEKLTEEETHRVYFLLSLCAATHKGLWIKPQLRETLALVAELSPIAIPYRTLCRSIFDTDPSALFMALYRCLEALYAFSHTTKLIEQLKIEKTWNELAQVLEETLSWRPREEQSLKELLKHAVQDDLKSILTALGDTVLDDDNIINRATKKIYNLRNSLVHYRPFHQNFQTETVNWNALCEATALLVLHVYEEIKNN